MERLRCVVERITYQNEINGYSVIKCRARGYQDLITVVGTMPETHVGSVRTLGGTWRVDSKYGRQFSVETYEETLPATVYGIEIYLGSGLVKGIGPKFAQRIVKQFRAETLHIIEEVQLQAIMTAVQSKILVLTGDPGTGKTTTTLGIITAFQEAGAEILLAAPTGRAAKRLAETTGMEAKTIVISGTKAIPLRGTF